MIKFHITSEIIQEAESRHKELGTLRGSFMNGERQISGLIGQILVRQYLGAEDVSNYHYDLIRNGKTIDVKTKTCGVAPRTGFLCSVPIGCAETKKCDYFAFIRVHKNFDYAWLLGAISWERFKNKSILYNKGEIDPTSPKDNPFVFQQTEYMISSAELKPFDSFVNKHCPLICS